MTVNNGDASVMVHDPLADIDALSSAADDILGLDMPTKPTQPASQPKVSAEASASEMVAQAEAVTPVEPEPEPSVDAQIDPDAAINLGEALTIREVAEMHERLLQAMIARNDCDYVLSAEDLQQVDGAGVQMLAAFVQEAARRGCGIRWTAPSEVLHKAAKGLGLMTALRLS